MMIACNDDAKNDDREGFPRTAEEAALDALNESVVDIIDDIVGVEEEEISGGSQEIDADISVYIKVGEVSTLLQHYPYMETYFETFDS